MIRRYVVNCRGGTKLQQYSHAANMACNPNATPLVISRQHRCTACYFPTASLYAIINARISTVSIEFERHNAFLLGLLSGYQTFQKSAKEFLRCCCSSATAVASFFCIARVRSTSANATRRFLHATMANSARPKLPKLSESPRLTWKSSTHESTTATPKPTSSPWPRLDGTSKG